MFLTFCIENLFLVTENGLLKNDVWNSIGPFFKNLEPKNDYQSDSANLKKKANLVPPPHSWAVNISKWINFSEKSFDFSCIFEADS